MLLSLRFSDGTSPNLVGFSRICCSRGFCSPGGALGAASGAPVAGEVTACLATAAGGNANKLSKKGTATRPNFLITPLPWFQIASLAGGVVFDGKANSNYVSSARG